MTSLLVRNYVVRRKTRLMRVASLIRRFNFVQVVDFQTKISQWKRFSRVDPNEDEFSDFETWRGNLSDDVSYSIGREIREESISIITV